MKKIVFPAILAFLMLASCSTVNYMGPRDFVSFHYSDNIKSSEQMTLDEDKEMLVTSFDHEFSYDDEGHLIKLKETEYFNRTSQNPQFAVWETEWKVIGDKRVPFQASVNGEVYCTIKYELMDIPSEGVITRDISKAIFYKQDYNIISGSSREFWEVSLNNYPVPFKSDKEFVKTISVFNALYGYSDRSVLTLGFDNILLRSYQYSFEKLFRGLAKSLPYQSYQRAAMGNFAIGEDVDFNYTWKAIADKPCAQKLSFVAKGENSIHAELNILIEYNSDGNRINEKWLVIDNDNNGKEISVFEQKLEY